MTTHSQTRDPIATIVGLGILGATTMFHWPLGVLLLILYALVRLGDADPRSVPFPVHVVGAALHGALLGACTATILLLLVALPLRGILTLGLSQDHATPITLALVALFQLEIARRLAASLHDEHRDPTLTAAFFVGCLGPLLVPVLPLLRT